MGVRPGKTSTETGKYPLLPTHLVSFIALNREKKAYGPSEAFQNTFKARLGQWVRYTGRLFGEANRSPINQPRSLCRSVIASST
ncbi:hypothetical protein DENIT_10767 [Pseudomonas veronii]|nr:hypothetical protein DENIT_10767 [Pseudomonas veronii]